MEEKGRIPTLHIVADSVPEAYFKAMKAVWNEGCEIRTEYDRKDKDKKGYIDPPSRDARVLVEIKNPFSQPRYPPVSFCEIGIYIAEILGVKDHKVIPLEKLREQANITETKWPYTYHQRLFSYPSQNRKIDQIEVMLERISKTPFTRRAVASIALPEVDIFMKEDLPCLREIQLRCLENSEGLVLNMNTTWRSRDLYKAWPDNVIALTFLQQVFAKEIEKRTGKKVKVGSYADYSMSLHIYGRDFSAVAGDKEKSIKSFFENFDEEKIIKRSMHSRDTRDILIIPQLEKLLKEEYWNFPPGSRELIEKLIKDLQEEKYIA